MVIIILIVLGFVFTTIGYIGDPNMSIWRFAYVFAGIFFAQAFSEVRSRFWTED